MSHCSPRRHTLQMQALRAQFAQADGLPFADVLPAERVEAALQEEGATWHAPVYTPLLTLWAFLTQVLSPDGSCRAAVGRVLAFLVARGQRPGTPKTGPYCKARQRLPETLLPRLTRETGRALHEGSPEGWRWKGRKVKVVDGTTVSMPDTPANQKDYPQSRSQQPGLGFPLARVVVVFCLGCGAVLDAALGRCRGKKTGENSLLRGLTNVFTAGDVILGDRCYGGWFDLALGCQRQLDVVSRLHQRRQADFRRGERLGPKDHVVRWPKPERPDWMDEATYAALPAELEVREVAVHVEQRGFRTRDLVVVTTLLDPRAYRAADLADLYRARWHAELDLRSLKIALGMDVLRCKSPVMVRKEFWAHLLVYNLIRTAMAQTALEQQVLPRRLSFQGALQALRAFGERLQEAQEPDRAQDLCEWVRLMIGSHMVGDRPDRVEPRARKRRPKDYPNLHRPRAKARTYRYTKT